MVYNCYKASCEAKGVDRNVSLSVADVRRAIEPKLPVRDEVFEFPKHVTDCSGVHARRDVDFLLRHSPAADRYFHKENYKSLRYDLRERRIVFPIRDSSLSVVDAVGRTVVKELKPKWRRYGSSSIPFITGYSTGVAVVVEDALSGVAVEASGTANAVALLGTALRDGLWEWAPKFKGLIVALDYDASLKALELSKKLSWYVPTIPLVIKRDLKYETEGDIVKLLEASKKAVLNGNC